MPRMTLHYIVDPMCSWCWAFTAGFKALQRQIDEQYAPGDVVVRYVMGGIAPDTDEPMSESLREQCRSNWLRVSEATGAMFNMDYWERNVPRYSTYPACRAAIAAGMQAEDGTPRMISAIQSAYYEQALNPSDIAVLGHAANEAGLDADLLMADMDSEPVYSRLSSDMVLRDRLGVSGFPSLVVLTADDGWALSQGYTDTNTLLARWNKFAGKSESSLAVQ